MSDSHPRPAKRPHRNQQPTDIVSVQTDEKSFTSSVIPFPRNGEQTTRADDQGSNGAASGKSDVPPKISASSGQTDQGSVAIEMSGEKYAPHRNNVPSEQTTCAYDQGSSAKVPSEKKMCTTNQGSTPEEDSRVDQEESMNSTTCESEQDVESTQEESDSDSSLGWSDDSSPEWTGWNSDKDDSDHEWNDAWSKRHQNGYRGLVTNPYLRKLRSTCHPCNPKTVHPCAAASSRKASVQASAAWTVKRTHGDSEVNDAKSTYGISFCSGPNAVRGLNVGRMPRVASAGSLDKPHKLGADAAKTKLLALENLNPFFREQEAKKSTPITPRGLSPRSPRQGSQNACVAQGTSDVFAQGIGLLVALLIVLLSANLHAVVAASTISR